MASDRTEVMVMAVRPSYPVDDLLSLFRLEDLVCTSQGFTNCMGSLADELEHLCFEGFEPLGV